EVPRHRQRRVHRLPPVPAPAAGRARGGGPRRHGALLRRAAEGGAARRPPRARRVPAPPPGPHRRGRAPRRAGGGNAGGGAALGRPGRGAPRAGASRELRPQQHRRHPHPAGGLPPPPGAAPAAGLHLLGLRSQRRHAVPRNGRGGDAAQHLCGQQAGVRATRPFPRAPVEAAGDGLPLLHRLRTLGPAGHGALPLHRRDPARRAHRRPQPRPHGARLHLRGRLGGGRGPAGGRAAGGRAARRGVRLPQPGRALPRGEHRQRAARPAARPHRRDRARHGPRGQARIARHAPRRGGEDLGRHHPAGGVDRLPAEHPDRCRDRRLRRVVPRPLRHL
ncbi:MAG: UDP-glucuronate 5'-epimerase, partial [uncultured Acetobacteraceae bacterium]